MLREHYAQGRLTVEEFDERLEHLYSSKTYGELATLTSDLPDVDLQRLPAPSPRTPERVKGPAQRRGLPEMWAAWAAASGINWAIWFVIGATDGFDFPYPWPLWVMVPWGVMVLLATLFNGRDDGSNR